MPHEAAYAAIFVDMGLIVALGHNVTVPLVRSGIFDLYPAAAPDPVAELEQRGIELRSATWTGDGHRTTPP